MTEVATTTSGETITLMRAGELVELLRFWCWMFATSTVFNALLVCWQLWTMWRTP